MKEKFELYEASHISEYWIVDPVRESITVYSLNDKNEYFGIKPFVAEERVDSQVIDELRIDVMEVFRN